MCQRRKELERLKWANSSRQTQLSEELRKVEKEYRSLGKAIGVLQTNNVAVPIDLNTIFIACEDKMKKIKQEVSAMDDVCKASWSLDNEISIFKRDHSSRRFSLVSFIRDNRSAEYFSSFKDWFDLGDYIAEMYNKLPNREELQEKIFLDRNDHSRKNATFNCSFDRNEVYPGLKMNVNAT